MSISKQSPGRRLRVITIDQAIAGASSVLIAVPAARLLGVVSFGLFGLLFLVYVMVVGVNRALVCDPLLVHPVEGQGRLGDVIGTSCVLGLVLGALVAVAGIGADLWNPRLGNALVVLAICIPLLALQDLGRYIAFATQRPTSAVMLDVAWLVFLFAGVGVIVVTDARTLASFIAAWAGSGAAAGLLIFFRYRPREVRISYLGSATRGPSPGGL